MTKDEAPSQEIKQAIIAETCKAVGFKPGSWQALWFSFLFQLPAHRFANLVAQTDQQISRNGLPAAMRWLTPRFANQVAVQGAERIPVDGPLLIASNHPGAFDILIILAQLERDDIKVIISDVPVTRAAQHVKNYLIYSTGDNLQERTTALRESIRQLRAGGVVVLFPTGVVDPDPSFMSGAEMALEDWSPSLAYLLRMAPETRLVPTIVSGVIAPRFLNNFLARRQKTIRSRQKVAEYLEIAQLMIVQKDLGLTPRISFGDPLMPKKLGDPANPEQIMTSITKSARCLLSEHMSKT